MNQFLSVTIRGILKIMKIYTHWHLWNRRGENGLFLLCNVIICFVKACEEKKIYLFCKLKAGVHAPIKSVSVPAPISLFPPVKPKSAVHTDQQNRYRRLQGGQFRE